MVRQTCSERAVSEGTENWIKEHRDDYLDSFDNNEEALEDHAHQETTCGVYDYDQDEIVEEIYSKIVDE